MNKSQQNFIAINTRRLLAHKWGVQTVEGKTLTYEGSSGSLESHCFKFALEQGWITKDETRVSAKGFNVATSYLK